MQRLIALLYLPFLLLWVTYHGPKDKAIGVRSQLEYYFCPVKCVMNYSHRVTCMQNNKELLKMITLLGVLLLRKSC